MWEHLGGHGVSDTGVKDLRLVYCWPTREVPCG